MNKFFSAIKNKTVWIVIGIIAILVGACLDEIISPLIYPIFGYPPPLAVLQIQGVEQKGYDCPEPQVQDPYTHYSTITSNKALVTVSPVSATLKFTADKRMDSRLPPAMRIITSLQADDPPQFIHIQVLDAAALDKPTTGTKDLDLKNEQTFTLELASGLYVITVSANWEHSSGATYAFLVEVK
jgi:hypothetical protein